MIGGAKIQKIFDMRVIEALKFNREILERLNSIGLKVEDCRFIDLYQDYELMHGKGEKKTYIVSFLAEKYGISERRVYGIIGKFGKCCTDFAAG